MSVSIRYFQAFTLICFLLIFTALAAATPSEPSGSWDSIHVFEAAERGRQAHYKLTSTIMLQMVDRSSGSGNEKDDKTDSKKEGEVTLSGSMTRQVCTENGTSGDTLTERMYPSITVL